MTPAQVSIWPIVKARRHAQTVVVSGAGDGGRLLPPSWNRTFLARAIPGPRGRPWPWCSSRLRRRSTPSTLARTVVRTASRPTRLRRCFQCPSPRMERAGRTLRTAEDVLRRAAGTSTRTTTRSPSIRGGASSTRRTRHHPIFTAAGGRRLRPTSEQFMSALSCRRFGGVPLSCRCVPEHRALKRRRRHRASVCAASELVANWGWYEARHRANEVPGCNADVLWVRWDSGKHAG